MEPVILLHKKGLSMRFQVPINPVLSQKAVFLDSEFLSTKWYDIYLDEMYPESDF